MWVRRGLPMVSDDVERDKGLQSFSQGAIETARMNCQFSNTFDDRRRTILLYLEDLEHPCSI